MSYKGGLKTQTLDRNDDSGHDTDIISYHIAEPYRGYDTGWRQR